MAGKVNPDEPTVADKWAKFRASLGDLTPPEQKSFTQRNYDEEEPDDPQPFLKRKRPGRKNKWDNNA